MKSIIQAKKECFICSKQFGLHSHHIYFGVARRPISERNGFKVDGIVSSQLLVNIFEHNTPLHDGAVIVRGDRVQSATCYLPLSDNRSLSKDLGTRHRAGIGISEVTDATVIIVSEETGKVSVAQNGELFRSLDVSGLRKKLEFSQNKKEPVNKKSNKKKNKEVTDETKGNEKP